MGHLVFKMGQLVQAHWADGTSLIGFVKDQTEEGLVLEVGGKHRHPRFNEATFQILKEPLPPEPQGDYAIVETDDACVWMRYGATWVAVSGAEYFWEELINARGLNRVIWEGAPR